MAKINIGTVRERDVDLAIMREFCTNGKFADLFAKQVGINGDFSVESVSHSVMDADLGESDVEVMLKVGEKKVVLLIENKIDADEQPQQYERYVERGNKKISSGEVAECYVFMTASQSYFTSYNKYANRVTFEDMLGVIDDDFTKAIIEKAIVKKASRSKENMDIHIVLARVKDSSLFDKKYKYKYHTLEFDNLERCPVCDTPEGWDDAHRRLWDYTKQLRGRKDYKRLIPKEFLKYINANINYNTKNSQFIEGDGYDDVAWFDDGKDIYVMFREATPKESSTI